MNWYRRLKFAHSFYGEFWIDDSGNAMYADGDVGDMGHEAYVIDSILSSYDLSWEGNGVDINDPSFIDEFVRENFEECVDLLISQGNMTEEQKAIALENPEEYTPDKISWIDEVISLIDLGDVLRINGASEEEIEMVAYNGDARLYAMKNWGWKRLQNLNVETWELTPDDMKTIAHGLYEAYNMEADIDEDTGDELDISINVYSTKKHTSMTYSQLESGVVDQKIDPITQTTQDAYQQALNQVDQPSNSFYRGWE